MDYFQLLGLAPGFDLDPAALDAAYFAAQRLYHPDRLIGKPAAERTAAIQRSADVNQAYNALKNPLTRAQYVLRLQGIAVGTEADSIKPSHGLLMETMEWRERIEEAGDAAALETLENLLKQTHEQSIATISNYYLNSSQDAMAEETLRLGYIIKAREAIMGRAMRMKKAL